MGAIFSPPKPKPIPLPPPVQVPTQKDNAKELAAAAKEERQRAYRQKGRANTLKTGSGILGDDSTNATTGLATKKLMGG